MLHFQKGMITMTNKNNTVAKVFSLIITLLTVLTAANTVTQ